MDNNIEEKKDSKEDSGLPNSLGRCCRVCAIATGGKMVDFFSKEGEEQRILEKMGQCLPIVVIPTDNLPQTICFPCLKLLNDSYELVNVAVNADIALRHKFILPSTETEKQITLPSNDDYFDPMWVKQEPTELKQEITEGIDYSLAEPEAEMEESLNIEGPMTCDLCGRTFVDMFEFDKHVSEEHLPPGHRCRLCDLAFPIPAELLAHKLEEHADEMTWCGDCKWDTPDEPTEKPFPCTYCDRKFWGITGLQLHLKKHVQVKRLFTCVECDHHCESREDLQIHKKSHKKPINLQCVTCHKVFTNETFYKRHRYIHDPEFWDRFKCTQCERPFRDAQALKNHVQLHSGVKPHMCDVCGRTYNRHANMLKHRKLHKPVSQWEHQCNQCDSRYERMRDLMAHLERAHGSGEAHSRGSGVKWVCRFCGKRISTKLSLQDHERIHTGAKPYVCEWCGREFRSRPNLLQHHLTHTGERKHACYVCGKRFARKSFIAQHMRVHTGEKPFECDICGHRFTQAGDMRRHRRRHIDAIVDSQEVLLITAE